MGLFSKRRSQDYQGFARYADEYNRHHDQAQTAQRAQSFTNASQAAVAALQMHQKQPAARPKPAQTRPIARANSLGGAPGGYARANSMQLYTYTPKASYTAGRAQPQRTASLRLNSLSGSVRLGPRRYVPQPVFPEEEEEEGEEMEGDVVITTKTTKVLDAQGRTRSITTETIRHMPDGLNVIETKTTNISRLNSRANSRTNSLQGGVSSVHHNAYNLNKIEEDLLDFDYTYLDHVPKARPAATNTSPDTLRTLRPDYSEPRKPVSMSPARNENRASSFSSTQSPRRLKSILKSSPSTAAAAAAASASAAVGNTDVPAYNQPELHHQSEPGATRHERPASLRLQPAPDIEPSHRLASLTSNGTSIKFLDKVETIPYTYNENYQEIANDEKHKKEQALQNNVDLYNRALQVAAEKVYGSPRSEMTQVSARSVQSPRSEDIQHFAEEKSEKKLRSDEKRSKVEASGVSKNYVYTNHHKDFSIRSLRNAGEEHHSSRKERAREEKRQMKEEEKKHAERLKEAEKQLKQEEKEAKKREKTPFSLFKRKKRESIGSSSMGSEEVRKSTSNDQLAVSLNNTESFKTPDASLPLPSAPPDEKLVSDASPKQPPAANIPVTGVAETLNLKNEAALHVPAKEVPVTINHIPSVALAANFNTQESSPAQPVSKQIDVESESEQPEHALAPVSTFDDDEDEFVDVPDNLGDDTDKRISTIPVLDQAKEARATDDTMTREEAAVSDLLLGSDTHRTSENFASIEPAMVADSRSSESIKIPERADLVRQPETPPSDVAVLDEPTYKTLAPKRIPSDELPTLVSGHNGVPQILTNTDRHVFQPKQDLNKGALSKTKEGSSNLADNAVPQTSMAGYTTSEKDMEISHNQQDTHQLESPVAVSPLLHSEPDTVEDAADSRALDKNIVNGTKIENHTQLQNVHEYDAAGEAERTETKDSGVKSGKQKANKKGNKFKRIIEKYFISDYSR
ncbi:hypothetical protein HF325_002795 [Metschnikowia pulcherrima]|uniref:Uncharacterized protein n=1 Tax=Metschnikowia pulcherrima TaxID=27326 RepID=A0A8H7GUV9_9ASCO|nr:hypothetical protein HF325_002795 [Metschnikowia pulcherrima]